MATPRRHLVRLLSRSRQPWIGFLIGQSSRALHLHQHRPLEQETVSDGGERKGTDSQSSLYMEEVGVLALHQQAAGVVCKIVIPPLQLAGLHQQFVVVTALEEEAVLAVFLLLLGLLFGLLFGLLL